LKKSRPALQAALDAIGMFLLYSCLLAVLDLGAYGLSAVVMMGIGLILAAFLFFWRLRVHQNQAKVS